MLPCGWTSGAEADAHHSHALGVDPGVGGELLDDGVVHVLGLDGERLDVLEGTGHFHGDHGDAAVPQAQCRDEGFLDGALQTVADQDGGALMIAGREHSVGHSLLPGDVQRDPFGVHVHGRREPHEQDVHDALESPYARRRAGDQPGHEAAKR